MLSCHIQICTFEIRNRCPNIGYNCIRLYVCVCVCAQISRLRITWKCLQASCICCILCSVDDAPMAAISVWYGFTRIFTQYSTIKSHDPIFRFKKFIYLFTFIQTDEILYYYYYSYLDADALFVIFTAHTINSIQFNSVNNVFYKKIFLKAMQRKTRKTTTTKKYSIYTGLSAQNVCLTRKRNLTTINCSMWCK